MRRRTLALAALVTAAAACEETRSPGPVRGPSFEETEDALPSPTPAPLGEGEWSLVLSGTAGLCGLELPPVRVYLSGEGNEFQISAQEGLLDVDGRWDGTNLEMNGGARRIFRPALDCIVDDHETFALGRTPDLLAGTFTIARRAVAGEACADALPGVTLPCRSTRTARLAFVSPRRAPKIEPFVPEASNGPALKIEKFVPSLPDPEGEPTSAPDLFRATPTPRATPEATPAAKAAVPKPKGKPKKKSR